MRRTLALCLCLLLAGCYLSDRGLSKLQVAEDLTLGSNLEDVRRQWYLYSTKPLVVDQVVTDSSDIVYRGASRDTEVSSFYLYFNSRTKVLDKVEWRYYSSMTTAKEMQLLGYWSKKLWPPSIHHRWGGEVYVWRDRNAELDLYLADGICHLIQKLD